MRFPLVLVSLWALLLLGSYLKLPYLLRRGEISSRRAWLLVGAMALGARLVPHCILPVGAGYDIESYQIVGDLVLRLEEVYSNPATLNRHPYLPLQMYWMALAWWGANIFRLPFIKIVRLAPIGADVGITLLLFLILRRSGSSAAALYGSMSYALNPVPVFVSAYHGQFDAIPTLCVLLALYWLERSSLFAGGWLGLGILDKSWPVLAFPALITVQGWRRKLLLAGAALAIPVIGIMVYTYIFSANPVIILKRALGYNWGIGVWGYTYFFRLLSALRPDRAAPFHWLVRYGRYLTLGALGCAWLIRVRKEPSWAGVLTILIVFLAVTHAFSIQYLMWIVPFGILNWEYRWLRRYTIGAFAYMFLAYTTLILEVHITQLLPWPRADWLIIMPAGLPAWLVTVGWARERLLGKRANVGPHKA